MLKMFWRSQTRQTTQTEQVTSHRLSLVCFTKPAETAQLVHNTGVLQTPLIGVWLNV